MPDPLVTDRQLAEALGLSRAMVQKMRAAGMPSYSFGRARRYRLAECIDWAADRHDAAA